MTYTQVLNRSITLLDEEGPESAYRFIKEEGFYVENANEAQIYNFAYCFAALWIFYVSFMGKNMEK